jgi:nucleoside-diphosphate-sugar epimerase
MAGTCAEYDWSKAEKCDELTTSLVTASIVEPAPYPLCKAVTQRLLGSYGATVGLANAWGRIFFQYGPYEHRNRLVSSVICSLLRNEPALCSHGTQVRSFLHVADVGAAFAALLDAEATGIFNVGSDEAVQLAQVAMEIGQQLGRPELIRLGARPANLNEPPVLLPDIARLRTATGWRARYALAEGLADTIAWWKQQLGTSQ